MPNRVLINPSNNLQITDVKLTGLLFSDLFLEPFLNNGMMFASFHSKGTTPSFNYKLNTLASGILICSTVSISSSGGITSIVLHCLYFLSYHFWSYN